jgi:uncharacterized MAPEG superfamily protein
MKPEVFWLALTALMTALMWLPNVLNRMMNQGVVKTLETPDMTGAAVESEWGLRARAAHANAADNLAIFAALVAAAQFAGVSNGITALGAALYFWGRLGHFVAYTLGIPYARTLIWTVAWVGQLLIAWQVLAGGH